jgi:hypothetical protein
VIVYPEYNAGSGILTDGVIQDRILPCERTVKTPHRFIKIGEEAKIRIGDLNQVVTAKEVSPSWGFPDDLYRYKLSFLKPVQQGTYMRLELLSDCATGSWISKGRVYVAGAFALAGGPARLGGGALARQRHVGSDLSVALA